MPNEEVFRTHFRTERVKPTTVFEADGTPLFTLQPQSVARKSGDHSDEHTLETTDPLATFAKFSEVVFLHESPHARVKIREGWVEPRRRFPCEFLLVQGSTDPDYRPLLEYALCLHHNVPVIVDLNLRDDYITFDRVVIGIPRLERTPDPDFDGIVFHRIVRDDEKHLRPERDLEAIRAALEALAPEPAKEPMPDDVEFR